MNTTPSKSSKWANVGDAGGTRREYDFADGVRGKFFHKDATHSQPVHLEADVLTYLQARAPLPAEFPSAASSTTC
jgi:hypothetical protein